MQGFPHHYVARAAGSSSGDVLINGEGLPELNTQSPPAFGGPEGVWSPETLLCASVADCFVLSFRAIAQASKFEWNSLECSVDGVLERPERVTFFTAFNVNAVLYVPIDANVGMAQRLLEKSEKICLVTNSLKSEVNLDIDIKVGQEPVR